MLASYLQITLGAAIMLRVISPFDPCSSYQLGFRGDIYLPWSVNCSCWAFELFILDTAPAYLIGLSRPNVLTYLSFSFFKNTRYLVLLLSMFSFLSLSQRSNFLKSSFLRQHPCSYWLPLCFDHQGEQRTNPWSHVVPSVSCCHLGVSI